MIPLVLSLTACMEPVSSPSLPGVVPPGSSTDPVPPPIGDDDDDDDPGDDCVPAASVVINELSPSNAAALLDEDGDSPDWIELANAGATAVDLADWSLSDDKDEPRKWVFPSVVLDPGELLVVFASGKDRRGTIGSWDTVVDRGDEWRYLEVVQEPDPAWIEPGFDDATWAVGPSGFGYGDGDDATEVTAKTVYARIRFDLAADDLAALQAFWLHVDYDDAFVAYLNGVEVARAGIGAPGVRPEWNAYADVGHDAVMFEGRAPEAFDLGQATGALVGGENTLAIEIHDSSAGSTDLSLIPFLTLGFADVRGHGASSALGLAGTQLHTSFSLKASGERVRLYDPAQCEADDVEPVALTADQSYGRQPDGTGELGYFLEPTPGAPNVTESRPGFAAPPTFDPAPGAYPGGTDVSAVASPGAIVRYALDGWIPTESDPTFDGAVSTGSDREAFVIRARAWEDGLWPSSVATATYLLEEPGELPIVALVTEPPNLWDEETGIYALGPNAEGPPYFFGANFWQDWERPVHMSEWEPDGQLGFAVDAGIEIHGNYTRSNEQKSLLVKLSSGYGDGAIEHEVFPGLGVTSFDRLLLRAAGNDWLGCNQDWCIPGAHLRDGLMQRIAANADLETLGWRPVEVYLNGEYWGVYHLNERSDEEYVRDHHGYEDIDLLEAGGVAVEGDNAAWLETMDWLRTHDLSDPANYDHVKTLIDVQQLQTYLAFEVFYDNTDWPGNNIKFWRPRTADGRWRWMLYDTDFGLGMYGAPVDDDSLAAALSPKGADWPNPPWSTELFRLLATSPQFVHEFVNLYADHLNTDLSPQATLTALHEVSSEIEPAMPRQVERWGHWTDGVRTNETDLDAWYGALGAIEQWLGERPTYARQHLAKAFGLSPWSITLDADPPGSGTFELAAVTVQAPFSGTYFRGVPVTITAVPAPGRTFVGWSDPTLPASPTVTIDANVAPRLVARFQ